MAADKLIDSHVSLKQAQLAINALHKHASQTQKQKEEEELLPGKEQNIWLVVGVKRIYPEGKLKPHKIPVKHVLVDPRQTNVCLITKDPQREYKDLLEEHKIKFISRVVGIQKLKGKWKPFDARRLLLKENGLFLADDRVIPLLPKLLGKIFFEAKKQPIPVNLTKKDLRTELENAINSTYMHQNQGTCTSVKVATLSHTPDQVLENLQTALPSIISKIRDGWDNIQSLHIKTNSSISLPIWTCELGSDAPGGRWHGLTATKQTQCEGEGEDLEAWGGVDGDVEDAEPEPKVSKPQKRKEMDEDSTPSAKKKSKKSKGEEAAESTPLIPTKKSKTLEELPSTPKSKKSTASLSTPATDPIKKKKSKLAQSIGVAEPLAPPPTPATPAVKKKKVTSVEEVLSTPTDSGKKKSKKSITVEEQEESSPAKTALKSAMKKKTVPATPTTPSLSSEKGKQKKVKVVGVEKKKQKLTEGKSMKQGAKAGLMGKKKH